MLTPETNYGFRRRLNQVHKPNRHDSSVQLAADEVRLDDSWSIVIAADASEFLFRIAQDLQDYLAVSMGINVSIRRGGVQSRVHTSSGAPAIVLATRESLPPRYAPELTKPRGYKLVVSQSLIVVCGYDERGTAQGSYRLEDIMNLRQAPFIKLQSSVREPIFTPRMVHSGWGIDNFPDQHLNEIAHAGIDAILVFTCGINMTNTGHLDFNNLIDRAAAYGLDVYLYSYLKSRRHPDDPDAEEFYENLYGNLIKTFPRVKGVVFVGESCEIPSKDEHTKGKLRLDPCLPGQEGDTRPSPGWWPCRDYPQWLRLVKRIMRKYNPNLDVVFWTYNWGRQPLEPRLALIRRLPKDISLEVTFEMFEDIEKDGVPTRCVDYTASFAGPGYYFRTEAEEAKKLGIPLYAMANTGGLSWDIGVIPYEPIPYQWKNRWDAINRANRDWGLVGLMECHHYGWWPSFISELSKEEYWTNGDDFDTHIWQIAAREFGEAGADKCLEAWKLWSSAFRDYPPTNEDQYGPFRVGPSYPLLYKDETVKFPDVPYAHFGARILNVRYRSHNPAILPGEIRLLESMERKMLQGLELLREARKSTPALREDEADRMILLGDFISRAVHTTINTKKWCILNNRLLAGVAEGELKGIHAEMADIARDEIANAKAAIPDVQADSRLGWEPSMEYMCDQEHLEWKIALLEKTLAFLTRAL